MDNGDKFRSINNMDAFRRTSCRIISVARKSDRRARNNVKL